MVKGERTVDPNKAEERAGRKLCPLVLRRGPRRDGFPAPHPFQGGGDEPGPPRPIRKTKKGPGLIDPGLFSDRLIRREAVEQFHQVALVRRLPGRYRVRPVAAPDDALGRRRDIGLRDRHDVIPRRACFGYLFGQRQHHPEVAALEQFHHRRHVWFRHTRAQVGPGHVVDDHGDVQPGERSEAVDDAVELRSETSRTSPVPGRATTPAPVPAPIAPDPGPAA